MTNCGYCQEVVEPEPGRVHNHHPECLIRMVAGSAAHQLGECTCYGGEREDPPGFSLREAAKLAYDTFQFLKGKQNRDYH